MNICEFCPMLLPLYPIAMGVGIWIGYKLRYAAIQQKLIKRIIDMEGRGMNRWMTKEEVIHELKRN